MLEVIPVFIFKYFVVHKVRLRFKKGIIAVKHSCDHPSPVDIHSYSESECIVFQHLDENLLLCHFRNSL